MESAERNQELQLKIETYGDMLFRLCLIRLQNIQDAEDVVQDVFYQYLKRNESFESEEHEKAWLLKVAVNACHKVWRSAWKRHQSGEEWQEASGVLLTAGTEGSCSPEEYSLGQEKRRQLLSAVMSLPAKYREVIHLFYYQQLSVKAIAGVTGRGESTVTSQLTRGRELLRKSLKEEYDFE